MAISYVNSDTKNGKTATTIKTANSPSVVAGDYLVVYCSVIPTTATPIFTQTSGTATIGSFATSISQVGSVGESYMSWVMVTGSGTINIIATFGSTINCGTISYSVFRGSLGIGQNTTGTGSTGTDISLSLTTNATNSWCVIGGAAEGTNTTINGGLSTTVEISNVVNQSTNLLSIAIGSNQSALAHGTTEALHLTKPTGTTHSAIMVELLGQANIPNASWGLVAI